jgi:thiosulfate/3-mercaptopyruvate sulfurtransferase
MKNSPIINASTLAQLLKHGNIVLIDARTGPGVKESYKKEHLHNALFVDLENELSQKTGEAANGGRHPLPPASGFAILLGNLGITPATQVVVYDDKNGANAAARFWWMMKALGHENVQVLDGGMKAAIDAGIELSDKMPVIKSVAPYPVNEWQLPTVDAAQVAAAAKDPRQLVIDVRETVRYRGESEPIDKIAGHIPGAVNIPYSSNLDEEGRFLPANKLAEKYKEAFGGRNAGDVIVHCGSGVTACHTLLAIAAAGNAIPNLYVGSWSEWSSAGRPVATTQ